MPVDQSYSLQSALTPNDTKKPIIINIAIMDSWKYTIQFDSTAELSEFVKWLNERPITQQFRSWKQPDGKKVIFNKMAIGAIERI